MSGYVDCHCHLADPQFDDDLEEIVAGAKEAGVRAIIVVPEYFNQFEKVLELCKRHKNFLVPCLGIHPVQRRLDNGDRSVTSEDFIEALPFIESHHSDIVGIGEVGLDFTPCYTKEDGSKEQQRTVLQKQVDLAKKYDLPLNVHSRSAGRPAIRHLKECGAEKVVLHSYTGNAASAIEGVKAGYYFSIPPSIARSDENKNVVKRVPIENILLETDSPYLGPVKQERNAPANVKISCEWIARIKGLSEAEVQRITTENACKLFPKLAAILKRE